MINPAKDITEDMVEIYNKVRRARRDRDNIMSRINEIIEEGCNRAQSALNSSEFNWEDFVFEYEQGTLKLKIVVTGN